MFACRSGVTFLLRFLNAHFCRGKISDAVVMENRGFGFVTFEDPKSAQKFLEVRFRHLSVCLLSAGLAILEVWFVVRCRIQIAWPSAR